MPIEKFDEWIDNIVSEYEEQAVYGAMWRL